MIRTFNQFIDWYVSILTVKEVRAALKAVKLEANTKKKDLRDLLSWGWKDGPNSLRIAISDYFEKQHQEAREDIRSKSRDECRETLDDLVIKYGIRSMVFVMIVHHDKYMNEIGYQLVNERGDEVEPVEDDEGDDFIETDSEITADSGNNSLCDLIYKIEEITEVFNSGQIVGDVEKVDSAVNRMLESWQALKEHCSQKQEFLSEISRYLEALNTDEQHTLLKYFRMQEFPLKLDLYKNVVPSDFAVVKGLLNNVCEICREASLLQSTEGSNIDVDRENWRRIIELGEQLEQKFESLSSILKLPKPDSKSRENQIEEINGAGDEREQEVAQVKVSPGEDEGSAPKGEPTEEVCSGDESIATDTQITAAVDEEGEPEKMVESAPAVPPERGDVAETGGTRAAAAAEAAAAVAVIEPESPDMQAVFFDAERCLWESLQDQDLATAYWLAREIEDEPGEDGASPSVPSWLLLSAFLCREASWEDIEEKDVLYNICMERSDHLDSLLEQMGVSKRDLALFLAAVALRPTLFAPETLASAWIEEALSLINNPTDSISALMQTVLDFSSHGKSLDRKLLRQATDNIDWQERAKLVSKEVAAWRDETSVKRVSFAPATETLRALAGPQSLISDAVDAVIKNDFTKLELVINTLNSLLSNRKIMNELVQQTTADLNKGKARVPVIDGRALEQIIRSLDNLRQLFIKWVDSVQIGDIQKNKNDWWYKKTWDFQRDFQTGWDVFEHELIDDLEQQVDIRGKAIRTYALGVFRMLIDEFSGPLSEKEVEQEQVVGWKQILSRPLLLLRGVPIDEENCVDIAQPFMMDESLLQAVLDKRSLKDAYRIHLEHNDFLLAELVVQELQDAGDSEVAELYKECEEMESCAQINLKNKIDHTRNLIVQATIDHVLMEEDRSQMDSQLLSIEEQETRRPFLLFQELDEIADKISSLREERQESLHDNIKQLFSELNDRTVTSGEQKNLVMAKGYLERSESALQSGDLPLADEFLHYAERAIDTGMEIEVEEETDKVKYVVEFVGVINDLHHYLENNHYPRDLVEQLSKGKSIAGLDMTRVPGARYSEIKNGLDTWLNMKRCKRVRENTKLLGEYLKKLLEYTGFQRPEIEYKNSDSKSAFYEARMSAGKLSPLADFGSQRNGVYDVVLVFSRPNAETIGHILHEYGVFSNCPIVIFIGRMTVAQRREWSDYCRGKGLTALLVDELLLYYLASQRESRLPALISCGTAWGYLIPYRSFGVIPPEIFKGRSLMVRELADPGGSCIVYGGRQFGKSVILHMVQREYDNPERGVYVIYDDIKPLGDPQGHYLPVDLWTRLREMLVSRGILYKGVSHAREEISQRIIEKLDENKSMQIIVLLDEADNFLAGDAMHNFEEVHELRRIMDQTERRFKVVFCGLHSVQRYCSGQNHPFAQMMARPLVVGPLEPGPARSLITEPMEAIGFSFDGQESRDAVLRILCYTNYHPALIQYFCGELVKLVRKRQQEPPYRITIADVEGIYRREDVRSFMRERFNWTLDLDIRYQVMVYSMITEQLNEMDGYRREFTVSEALDYAAWWWPHGFASISLDEAKALLDELIGLGVLVKRINGKYRLRNGNVVRALGSGQEISERLLSISSQPAPDTYDDARSYRLKLDNREISPLTIKQANELTKSCSGVGIVFGSRATDICAVPDTLKLLMSSNSSERCQQLPPDIVTLEQLIRFFDNSIYRKQTGCEIFYTFAGDIPIVGASLVDTINEVSRFLSRYSRRISSLRWILIFDALATRKWFEESADLWKEAEGQVDAVVYLMRWDQKMIKRYLTDKDILDTPPIVENIYEVTGGWPYLLNKLWGLMKDPVNIQLDPRVPADLLKEKLVNNIDGLADDFLAALGINEVECGLELVKMFKELGPISWNEISEGVKTYDNPALLELTREKVQTSIQTLQRLNVLVQSERGLEAEPVAAGVIAER